MDKLRVIIVPLTSSSIEKLDFGIEYDEVDENEYMIWKISNREFSELNSSGVLQSINERCKILIDDYENERIQFNHLDAALGVICNTEPDTVVLKHLETCLKVAKKAKTFVELDF